MASRQYAQREWRLLSWWLATFHHQADITMNVRLGPTVGVSPLAAYVNPLDPQLRVRNRWADAVFIENGEPHLVEAKIEPDPGIFSQLVHYARKFRADPNYTQFKNSALHLIALVYHDDPSVAIEAPYYGVRWIVFQPALDTFPPAASRGNPLSTETSPIALNHDWPARLQSWGIKALGL